MAMMGSGLASTSEPHPDIGVCVCVFTVFSDPCKVIRSRSADGSETGGQMHLREMSSSRSSCHKGCRH